MNCIFLRRGYPEIESEPTPIAVTVTGTGENAPATVASATIGGTQYASAVTLEVVPNDVITLNVQGGGFLNIGRIYINGTQVAYSDTYATVSYDWTVPSDISAVEIALAILATGKNSYGSVTVTTS